MGELETNLDTPHQLPQVLYDELDTQNYHDHEQLCLEEREFVPLEKEIEQQAQNIMYDQENCSNHRQTSAVTSGDFFRTEALEDLHITNLFGNQGQGSLMFLPYLKDLSSHNSTPSNETLTVATQPKI